MPIMFAARTLPLWAALCLLPACAGLPTDSRTDNQMGGSTVTQVDGKTVITPSRTAQDCRSQSDWSTAGYCGSGHIPAGACRVGLGPGQILDLKDESPQVGFSHRNNPGTPPLLCWAWVSTVSRAYVNFDVASLLGREIAQAKLVWDPVSERNEAGATSSLRADSAPYCVKRLFEATAPWKAVETPGSLISDKLDTVQAGNGVVVTEVVKKWVQAGGGQFGLFFAAGDESPHPKNNKTCATTLHKLRLEVTY